MYTISLLLLLVTWSPFYLCYIFNVVTTKYASVINISPLITAAATLYAPLSALLHGYRNTKVRRELCQMFSFQCNDVATPLPTRKVFRSISMREATRQRHKDRLLRHSFIGELNHHKNNRTDSDMKSNNAGDCSESHKLLLTLAPSSTGSSTRSSFSFSSGHLKFVNVLADREEATC